MSTFQDAQTDSASLAKLVNEDTDVTTRYGANPKVSAPKAIRLIEASGTETVNQIQTDAANAIATLNTSRGFRVVGDFASGLTYELANDVAVDGSGNYWVYADINALPVTVSAGTTPSEPTYTQVTFNQASGVTTTAGINAQQFIDNFELKIFQSPTDNLTKVSTFAGGVGAVYEVRKTSDNSLATIYSDKDGVTEIAQNGTSNVSDANAEVVFYVDEGDYTVTIGGVSAGVSTIKDLIKGNPSVKYEIVGFALRNYGTIGAPDWQFISDSIHGPTNAASVSVVNGRIRVSFGKTYGVITTLVAATDETMGRQGFQVGASVGTSFADIEVSNRMQGYVNTATGTVTAHAHWGSSITGSVEANGRVRITHPTNSGFQSSVFNKTSSGAMSDYSISDLNSTVAEITGYREVSGYVTYNGADFVLANSSTQGLSLSYDSPSSTLTISTPSGSAAIPPIIQTRYNNTVTAISDSFGASDFTVKFIDNSLNLVTTPTTDFRFSFHKPEKQEIGAAVSGTVGFDLGYGTVDASNLVVAGGNIWCIGLFEV